MVKVNGGFFWVREGRPGIDVTDEPKRITITNNVIALPRIIQWVHRRWPLIPQSEERLEQPVWITNNVIVARPRWYQFIQWYRVHRLWLQQPH